MRRTILLLMGIFSFSLLATGRPQKHTPQAWPYAATLPTLASYSQSKAASCGAACAITGLAELGYAVPLTKKNERAIHARMALRDREIIRILKRAGTISRWQGVLLRVFRPPQMAEGRIILPHALFDFLEKVDAKPAFWFDRSYIDDLLRLPTYSPEMRLLGESVITEAGSLTTALPGIDEIEAFLDKGGRLIVPFARSTSSHYFLLRKNEGKIMVMDPSDGGNFEAPEWFLQRMLSGKTLSMRFDFGLRFIGAVIAIAPRP